MAGPRISTDPDEAFLGIFESLNWAVALVDRVGRDADVWRRGTPEGELIAGFRYARNAVHHDWSDALHVTPGAMLPSPLPFGLFEWRWRPKLEAKRTTGERHYLSHLADKPVRFTLSDMAGLFMRAATPGDSRP